MRSLLPLLLLAILASPRLALATPVYSHIVVSSDVDHAAAATGAPDGSYIHFTNSSAWIEFGFPQKTNGDVHLRLRLADADGGPWESQFSYWLLDGGSYYPKGTVSVSSATAELDLTLPNTDATLLDRIRVFAEDTDLEIDAAWIDANASATMPEPVAESEVSTPATTSDTSTLPPEETIAEAAPTSPAQTSSELPIRLIKLPDDGDPSTQYDSAVYLVDQSGKRRPFSNETVFFSWFTDFSLVEVLSPSAMAAIPLGGAVPMHPGTWLVKLQSTPTVYAVEANATLRPIPDEVTARLFYGDDWSGRVRDLPPTDWPRYHVGDPMSYLHANGTLLRDANGTLWFIRNGVKRAIPLSLVTQFGVQLQHVLDLPEDTSSAAQAAFRAYPEGARYTADDALGWYLL